MMRLSARQYLLVIALLVCVIAPSLVFGAVLVPIVPTDHGCSGTGGCQDVCALAELAQNVLTDAIVISIFLAAILFAFAGLKMVTSPANPGQMNVGKKLFYNVLVGFIIILAAWLIVNTIMSVMLGQGTLPWNKIC